MIRSILAGPAKIQFTESEIPVPAQGEVLVKLKMVGVCGSDVHLFKRGNEMDEPIAIGHEGMGIIEAVGDGVSRERIGARVVIEPNIPCMNCPECRKGRGNVCRNKRIIGVNETGCFAEYIGLPGEFAHGLPDSVSDTDAVAMEPAVVALSALNRSDARPGDAIAVIGLGAIGMLLTHIALALGYRVLVVEPVKSKIKKAAEMGALPVQGWESSKGAAGILESAFQEQGVTTVFECAGSESSATMAIEAVPHGADIILLGLSEGATTFRTRLLSRKGNHITPSLIYDHPLDFKRCINLVERGMIQPGMIISGYYDLKDLQEALTEAGKGTEGKIVIRITGH